NFSMLLSLLVLSHLLVVLSFFFLFLPPHISTLFPYTTLFRSHERAEPQLTFCHGPSRVGLSWLGDRHGMELRHHAGRRRLFCFQDRKSTRLNSSHQIISYAVFCLKKKNKTQNIV